MRAAPHPNEYDEGSRADRLVADPLSDETLSLWQSTAKKNRDIFTEVFRPVPSDLVPSFDTYKVRRAVMVPHFRLLYTECRCSLMSRR